METGGEHCLKNGVTGRDGLLRQDWRTGRWEVETDGQEGGTGTVETVDGWTGQTGQGGCLPSPSPALPSCLPACPALPPPCPLPTHCPYPTPLPLCTAPAHPRACPTAPTPTWLPGVVVCMYIINILPVCMYAGAAALLLLLPLSLCACLCMPYITISSYVCLPTSPSLPFHHQMMTSRYLWWRW